MPFPTAATTKGMPARVADMSESTKRYSFNFAEANKIKSAY